MILPSPRDAAAVILVRANTDKTNPEIFWVKRNPNRVFLGCFYAFPGGKAEPTDAEAKIENCDDDRERATMISCAAREMFEETGVLLAHGAETLTVGQRASLLDDLESGRMSWPELLRHYGLHLDANDFTFAGRWVTPPFSPRRFDTWFFLVRAPRKQEPRIRTTEFAHGEWTNAQEAYTRWLRSEVLVAPPVLHAVKTLAAGLNDDLIARFLAAPQARREPVRRIEFLPGFIYFPLRTPTKPPATHTNAYIVGRAELVIIDPGSPYEEEQTALAACVDELIGAGRTVREIILTHHHPDH